jgi:hypothetical protein
MTSPATLSAAASGGPSAQEGEQFYALETPAVPATVEVSAASAADEIVCRRETPIGTKFSRRVCRTRAELELRAEMDQKQWYQMRRY